MFIDVFYQSGSIRTKDDLYIIHPIPHRLKRKRDNHIIFRASDMPADHVMKKMFTTKDSKILTLIILLYM